MDVESLYTNIDHKEGLKALMHYLEKRPPEQMPPAEFILKLTEWTLTNNVFLFQNKFFKHSFDLGHSKSCYSFMHILITLILI